MSLKENFSKSKPGIEMTQNIDIKAELFLSLFL